MLQPGSRLQNRYRIIRQIGGGGMAVVYLAEDIRLVGRYCAVKEMSPAELAPKDRGWALDAFEREAQMLARLHDRGLTAVTDFFSERGNWYLVMDYVEGETLQQRLERARGGRLPLEEALDIARQLCKVLTYLHGQNPPVVFRDLKPSNVMITPEGEVKLIDFGIARFFKGGQREDTVLLGTPGYAAPEQYGGAGQSDPRADIYSLGVLLHQMVTGHNPTTSPTPFSLPSPADLRRDLPPHVEEVLSRATQVHPDLRYHSVEELRSALSHPERARPQPRRGRSKPRRPRDARVPGGHSDTDTPGRGLYVVLGAGGILLIGVCVLAVALILPRLDELLAFFEQPTAPAATVTLRPTHTRAVPPASTETTDDAASEASEPTAPPPTTPLPTDTPTQRPQPTLTPDPASAPLRMAYVVGPVANTDVYVANADGLESRCVACRPCDEAEPAWSPDGSRIAYQANCDSSYDIWVVPASGGNPTQLTRSRDSDEREPDWSPDGSQIVFRSSAVDSDRNADGDLRVMNANGSGMSSLGEQGRTPVWSRDGRWIAFMSERSGSWEIYVYNVQSRNTERITNCSANCRWPAWSPDSLYVIYHSTTGPGSVEADRIFYVPVLGGSPTLVLSNSHPGRPTWSTSGLIAFNSDRGIEVVNENGSRRRTLVGGERNWAPVWSK